MFQVLPVISIIFNVVAVVAVALHSVESIRDSSKDKSGKVIENVILTRIILVSVTWISIEYVLRLFSSPTVTRFLFDGCNIIDLLGCGLYFYMLLQSNKLPDRMTDLFRLYVMFRAWKIPWEICKLFYDRSALRLDFAILINFNKQFGILLLFFLTGVIMFSTAIYTAEKDEPESPFTSIPETFWYTIATLTTAGNTPVHPTTVSGKYFGALCSIVGLLFLAAVITIGNFVRVLQSRNPQPPLHPPGGVSSYGAGGMPTATSSRLPQPVPGAAPSHRTDDTTSFHHITFNDDMMSALGTIDVLVERDKKPVRVSSLLRVDRMPHAACPHRPSLLPPSLFPLFPPLILHGYRARNEKRRKLLQHLLGMSPTLYFNGMPINFSFSVFSKPAFRSN